MLTPTEIYDNVEALERIPLRLRRIRLRRCSCGTRLA